MGKLWRYTGSSGGSFRSRKTKKKGENDWFSPLGPPRLKPVAVHITLLQFAKRHFPPPPHCSCGLVTLASIASPATHFLLGTGGPELAGDEPASSSPG
uniref:Uncharacterized protein n=1 Tax=Leersia perrieri TaxID=77586 RepID=A0A0D9W232_9ORYZ